MTAKDVRFDHDARSRLLRGMETLAGAVRVTLGPRGRNVILDGDGRPPRSTKDGVAVAREIELEDRFENLGARLLRDVAGQVNDDAGDGTTTAIVLGQAIAREGLKAVSVGLDPVEVRRGIEAATEAADANVAERSRAVNDRAAIVHVGLVASNGDRQVAEMLADAFERVGRDGAVTVEQTGLLITELEVVEGIQFEGGYLSPHFVTDDERMTCELRKPRVLLHDGKITDLRGLLPILEAAARDAVPLLIVADDVEGEALSTLVVNKLRGGLDLAAVKAPGFGDQRKALLDDLAAVTGATVVRSELGVSLGTLTVDDLGRAERVAITKDTTVLIGPAGREDAVAERMAWIRGEMDQATTDRERDRLELRLASLAGGVAVVRVGGLSESEVSERKDRVEDAVSAVRAALAEGVVPGGGLALLDAAAAVQALEPGSRDRKAGIEAVRRALEAPLRQIADNAGLPAPWIAAKLRERLDYDTGLDARTGEFVNAFDAGVIDPARVVRVALRSAASVAGLLAATDAMVVEHVEPRSGAGTAVAS